MDGVSGSDLAMLNMEEFSSCESENTGSWGFMFLRFHLFEVIQRRIGRNTFRWGW